MNSRSSKKALACCGEGVCSLDIRILKVYSNLETYGESIVSICNELNLELNQIRFIKEKLERFGLLQSRNEEINDDNLKKVNGTDSYRITPLGKNYLTMIDR